VIGGSAIVSLAYRSLNFHGRPFVIRPIIIPKLQFESFGKSSPESFAFDRAVSDIPPRGRILLCFGEQDCEAFAVQLRKAPESLEIESPLVARRLEAFALKLETLSRFAILVHPVPPLPRAIVNEAGRFNKSLKAIVAGLRGAHPNVEFLDLTNLLVDEAKGCVRPEVTSDGIMFAPGYLRVLENYINARPTIGGAWNDAPMPYVTLEVE
jgi:hypothetical protein